MKLEIGNDFGNSSVKMGIGEDIITQPSVYCAVNSLDHLDEISSEYVLENIYDMLVVTIESTTLGNLPKTYYVGNYALTSGNYITNIGVGGLNDKANSDVPIIVSLAIIAANAAKCTLASDSNIDSADVTVDLATAIPVSQYSKSTAKMYAERFMGSHKVTLYIGSKKFTTNIVISFAYVLPEGIPSMYYLTRKHSITELSKYNFKTAKIQHVSIGEGTTEYPQTYDGVRFDSRYNFGDTSGVGKAAEKVMDTFIAKIGLAKYSRQELMNVIRNPKHKYHDIAAPLFDQALEEQANVIMNQIRKQLEQANFEVDYVLVYGGGSILMRKYLEAKLTAFTAPKSITTIFVPEEYAVILESLGLNAFVHTKVFAALKKNSEN